MENSVRFLNDVLREIKRKDSLHSNTLEQSMMEGAFFNHLRNTIYQYFEKTHISPVRVANDYLLMIQDMRIEGIKFAKTGQYSCTDENEAIERVYANVDVMPYYLNALMLSQLLWPHHFYMLHFFATEIRRMRDRYVGARILDIGAGHGLFSKAIQDNAPHFGELDILDISKASLDMTKRMIGIDRIKYTQANIFNYCRVDTRYDLIIMGELLEHLKDPVDILRRTTRLLSDDGMIWLTVPTNAPAIDHIYLFRSEQEVFDMINEAQMKVMLSFTTNADKQTQIVGAFCVKR